MVHRFAALRTTLHSFGSSKNGGAVSRRMNTVRVFAAE